MKRADNESKQILRHPKGHEFSDFNGYPLYPEEEDIYRKFKKIPRVNPEDITQVKVYEKYGKWNEKNFEEDMSGDDLDVPGAEFDDEQEKYGSEDEENNYYSLGGDEHYSLEENQGS